MRISDWSSDVCSSDLFVNDHLDRPALEVLAAGGTRLLALRSAGYNNVDLKAANELGLSVARVPSYSPHAIAEHSVALMLSLNRKIHRAYAREIGRASCRERECPYV